ncbi:MAG: flippase [Candidatus Thermoplasmatota archaeon]|nr:flippase [Candidatus Thermoplasmatota archaeon]
MSDFQRVAKNTFALFIAQIISSILSILLGIFIARNLGDIALGKYSFAYTFVVFFSIFLDLGYNTLLIREVARDKSKANKYVSNLLSFRAISALIVFVFIVVTINLMGYPSDTKNIVYLFAIYIFLEAFSSIYKVTFRAFERMEYESAITILSNIIRVSLALVVIFFGYGLVAIGLVFIFSNILDLSFSTIVCERRFVKSRTEFDFSFFKSTIKLALPLVMVSLFTTVFVRADTILLSIFKGDEVVGWYNAAYSLVLGLRVIPGLIVTAIVPTLSYYYIASRTSLKVVYEKYFRYLFMLGLPTAMGASLLSDKIILLLYGSEYTNSIIALRILSWDILLIFLYTILSGILISIDKQNEMAIAAAVTALVNVIINIILIPYFSYVGAAVATISSETILFVIYFYLISKHIYLLPIHKMLVKPFVALVVMSLFIFFFNWLGLFLLVILSIFVYFVTLYLIKGISKEDFALIRQIIKIPNR